MGYRLSSAFSRSGQGAPGAAGAEFVCVTAGPIIPPFDNTPVFISWSLLVTIGAGTTAATVRCRRGPLVTDPVVFSLPTAETVTAGNNFRFTGSYVDTPPAQAATFYCMTLAGTGTTGAWAPLDYSLFAFVL